MVITHTFGGKTENYEAEFISEIPGGYRFKSPNCPVSSFGSKSVDEDGNEIIITQDSMRVEDDAMVIYFTAKFC